ncbi:poly-beta-1,6-N-acetyl-D-glucosamine biosynthesis protein PgaD [Gluconacetobacter aggeris]|uniref:Poly-beta-1,6-N-acetyl-D-glucosamine biosynthesis protein PgaD n=1 Tax=Gluconacetobacter aggeris TaxID=1286186 RepID=A0A7W4IWQ8_9PROT|nr:poly-beta-1,6-N-acetyl-D-glucosamine biosynthesis protein PgaD [Gluconacetobacter aggeris]MBB2170258.1 poly-beta-1,6-N-acetyl-D-glucosamine biosynthesis protein PgaD [Gluconacetobacter aggeris]
MMTVSNGNMEENSIMNDKVIKTQRTRFYIVVDIVITIFAWGGFVFLLASGFFLNFFNVDHAPVKASVSETIGSLLFYGAVMIVLAAILIGWALYNKKRFSVERRKRREDIGHQAVADSFDIDQSVLGALQANKISRVHHDHGAKITRVDNLHQSAMVPPAPTTETPS